MFISDRCKESLSLKLNLPPGSHQDFDGSGEGGDEFLRNIKRESAFIIEVKEICR